MARAPLLAQAPIKITLNPFTKTLTFAAILALGASTPAAEKKPVGGNGNGSVQRLPTVTSLAGPLLEEQPVDKTGRPGWTGARTSP